MMPGKAGCTYVSCFSCFFRRWRRAEGGTSLARGGGACSAEAGERLRRRGRSREAHARRRATAGARAVRRRAGGGKDSMAGEMFPRQSVEHQYRYRYLGCGVSEGAQCSDAWPLNGSPRHETIAALRLCPFLLCSSSPRRLCHMVASHPIWRLNGTRHSERTMDGGWLATNRRWAGTAECIRP